MIRRFLVEIDSGEHANFCNSNMIKKILNKGGISNVNVREPNSVSTSTPLGNPDKGYGGNHSASILKDNASDPCDVKVIIVDVKEGTNARI
jgi:hypothetical protein